MIMVVSGVRVTISNGESVQDALIHTGPIYVFG